MIYLISYVPNNNVNDFNTVCYFALIAMFVIYWRINVLAQLVLNQTN